MGRFGTTQRRLWITGLGALLLAGCATAQPSGYDYFHHVPGGDPWSPKIAAWQSRERAVPDTESLRPAVSGQGASKGLSRVRQSRDLRSKYFAFRQEQKRAMAKDVARWIQREAKRHYVPDGPLDHWATLEETLARDGDDCDGLELLAYHFLLDHGFGEDEVFRAIVFRPSDGQHHMVTLWFESPDDPWVIDPTGAMTSGMPRMSEVPAWAPIKLFSETEEFTVEQVSESFASR